MERKIAIERISVELIKYALFKEYGLFRVKE
jgi:hypothetical protein